MATTRLQDSTAKIARVEATETYPETYCKQINDIVGKGFIVLTFDGYNYYQVVGVTPLGAFLQITTKKQDTLVCDVVEWGHPLIIKAQV